MAWDKTKPADNEKLKDSPALLRANWQAIESGTDPALKITNAKVADDANIADTKLAKITTPGKVGGAAITELVNIPSGAGLVPIANMDHGTTANKMLKLDGNAKIPAVDGSQLTHLNGSAIDNGTVPAANVETGTTANKIVKLDANAKLPAVDGSQLTNIPVGSGEVVQIVMTEDQTARSLSAPAFPGDNTKPQNNEGAEYTQLATTITPKNANNILIIDVEIQVNTESNFGSFSEAFLFKGTDADALAGGRTHEWYALGSSGSTSCTRKITFSYKMTAGGTSAITFKVRMGCSYSGLLLNQDHYGYTYGGILTSSMKITEVKA